jgi:hypothetical protein
VKEHSSGATTEKQVGDETLLNLCYATRNCFVSIILEILSNYLSNVVKLIVEANSILNVQLFIIDIN